MPRATKKTAGALFSHADLEDRTRPRHPLRKISQIFHVPLTRVRMH